VELFEQIRREYTYGAGTIQGVANKLGIHRRMVREALADAVPRERKITLRRRPKLEAAVAFIEAILEGDRTAPQKAAAHRAPDLVPDPSGDARSRRGRVLDSSIRSGAEDSTEIGSQETFIPQSYCWGGEAQVDWLAYADICGEREKAYVFCMRSMASGGAFHCAFPHASPASIFGSARTGVRLFFWSF
jgi:hypothetical protein